MKINKYIIVFIFLMAILSLGIASASEDIGQGDTISIEVKKEPLKLILTLRPIPIIMQLKKQYL